MAYTKGKTNNKSTKAAASTYRQPFNIQKRKSIRSNDNTTSWLLY